MAVSKVVLNGNTLMDTTDKTVTDASMLSGVTALKNDGTTATGNIATKTSANLSASGNTVTAPAGYYASAASASVSSGTEGTPTVTKGTVSNHAMTVTPSVTNTAGYISGGTKTGTAVTVSASELVSGNKAITSAGTGIDVADYATASVASGSATTPATTVTANPSISVSSGGLITATASATQSVTPTVSAGYVSSGTAGTITVSGSNTEQLSTQAAQTIHPSTTAQSIASGKYLIGAQTIAAVVLENLTAGNIKKDVVVKVGDSSDDDCVASVTGTYEGGGGSTGLVYETGTYTPSADVARPTINFSNSHTKRPFIVIMQDMGGSSSIATQDSNLLCAMVNWYDFSGDGIYNSAGSVNYAKMLYVYKGSSNLSSSSNTISSLTSTANTGMPYWLSNTSFIPGSASSSRYWRSGRTYKWIAVWAPST